MDVTIVHNLLASASKVNSAHVTGCCHGNTLITWAVGIMLHQPQICDIGGELEQNGKKKGKYGVVGGRKKCVGRGGEKGGGGGGEALTGPGQTPHGSQGCGRLV